MRKISFMMNVYLFRIFLAQVLLWVALVFMLTLGSGCSPEIIIDNPYKNIDWGKSGQYLADLHIHTSRSDGHLSPHVVVDRFHDLGFKILAFADHNLVTYPWQEFSSFKAGNFALRLKEQGGLEYLPFEDIFVFENRDPTSLGMLAIQASEVSQHHHLGSYFSDHPGGILETEAETLEAIAKKNGLAVLFHPGNENKPVEWYADIFRRYEHLIGMEAYTTGLMFQPGNVNKWDSTLIRLMPERPVWGFSNEDYHSDYYVNSKEVRHMMGRNGNIFLLSDFLVEEFRLAMEDGEFLFFHAPQGPAGPSLPKVNSIKVNSQKGTIHIDASGYEYIEWISDGRVVFRGSQINLPDIPDLGNYVRANIHESEEGPFVGTQPFGIRRQR